MKRVLQFISLFILLLIIPVYVEAKELESELSSVNGVMKYFEIGKVSIVNVGYTRYSNIHYTGKAGVSLSGIAHNKYTRDVELEVSLNIYNKKKELLLKRNTVLSIEANSDSKYTQYVYEDEIDFTLDDIAYYSVSADIISDVEILDTGSKDKYYLENYNVEVNVLENNVYEVNEKFIGTFYSNVEIFNRGISFRHRYVRQDGTKINKRAIISDIKIDDYYKVSTEKGLRLLKVGKEIKDIATKEYDISYKYNVGKDILDNKDEFVYYLISNMNVKVDGISFRIIMPKEFNKEGIRFVDFNGIELENVNYEVNGNVITGNISGVINPGTAYGIQILLPDNYFKNASNNISSFSVCSIIVPIIFMFISFILWFIYQRGNKKITYNSIYFNEKINSLEVGYLYNGLVKDNDIASLLFQLANKGYIEIVKNKKSYKIVKKAGYTEDDRVEMAFLKELFFDKDELTRKELLVSLTDMSDAIRLKLDNKKKRKRKIFTNSVFNYKLLYWVLIIIVIVLNTSNILLEYQPSVIVINSVASCIGYILLLSSLLSKNKVIEKVLYGLVALIMIVSPIVLTSYEAFLQDNLNTVSYVLGIIIILVIACISNTMSNRTVYGNLMLNKIKAYKNYLINSDKDIIEKEYKNNKNCLYDVLPYSMVLGVSDKWIDKFRDIEIDKPSWYVVDKFELDEFYLDVINIYSDIFIALKNDKGSN